MDRLLRARRGLSVLLLLLIAVAAFLPVYTLRVSEDSDTAADRFGLGIPVTLSGANFVSEVNDPGSAGLEAWDRLSGLLEDTGGGASWGGLWAGLGLLVISVVFWFILMISCLRNRFGRGFQILSAALPAASLLSCLLLCLFGVWLTGSFTADVRALLGYDSISVSVTPYIWFWVLTGLQIVLFAGHLLLRRYEKNKPPVVMEPILIED